MSIEAETPDEPRPQDQDADLSKLKNATARLMEHFDTVHIFVTRHVSDDEGTTAASWGGGNWYARRGQIGDWILKQEASAQSDE